MGVDADWPLLNSATGTSQARVCNMIVAKLKVTVILLLRGELATALMLE